MANKAFDRTIVNPLERPLSPDINQLQSQADREIRDTFRRWFQANGVVTNGFLDTSLKVFQDTVPDMGVTIKAGEGFIDTPSDVPSSIGGIVGLDDLSPFKPLPLSADQAIAIDPAPGVGQERIDIIEVKVDRRAENSVNRDILNTGTGLFVSTLVNKTLAFDLLGRNGRVVSPASSTTGIGYKVGVAAAVGTAVVPATTAGYTKLCEIYVGPTVTTIVNANITDRRTVFPSIANFLATANIWTALNTFQAGIAVTQSTTNGIAVDATGNGTGFGVRGTGGAGGAAGVVGLGTGTAAGVGGTATGTGPGVLGNGAGVNAGVVGNGGSTSGTGVIGNGGATNGIGVNGVGVGTGQGVFGSGGGGTGAGVHGVGGSTGSPAGVEGVGGTTNGIGVTGQGTGTGAGVTGAGAATGGGPGGQFSPSTTRGAVNVVASPTAPSTPQEGDLALNGTTPTRNLQMWITGAWRTIAGPF